MIRDIRYILKKVIIGFLVGSLLIIFKMNIAHAEVYSFDLTVSGYSIATGGNSVWVQGNYANLVVNYDGLPDGILAPTDRWQVSIALCRYNAQSGIDIIEGSSSDKASVNNTQYVCGFPNSQLTGNVTIVTFDTRGGGSYNRTWFRLYQSVASDYSLLGYRVWLNGPLQPQDFGYLPNQTQINQNNTIINNQNAQTQILNNVVSAVNNSSQFIQTLIGRVQNLEDTMKDDSIDESFQGQKISDIQGSGYSNGSISDIILLPVTLINKVVDGLSSNSCSSFNLGSFYGTNIVLPCYTSSDVSGWLGTSVYTIIDLLMSFGVIIGIRKLVLKIYNTIVFLKEGGSTID